MRFRFRAFGLHLLASACVLTAVLGTLYLGWYRWPGWYVVGVPSVAAVLVGVDLTLGPLFTFIVASAEKPRRELARDIAIIATVQLGALVYGTVSLWSGRPLYYVFSTSVLELVQAYDINPQQAALAARQKSDLRPHWYSLPRWIWAPLPSDPKEAQKIVISAISGGDDVVSMPRYFKHWDQGLPTLRKELKKVDDVGYFTRTQKSQLKARMRALGLDPSQSNTMPLTGRGDPLLVVFDPKDLHMVAMLAPPRTPRLEPQHWMVQRYFRTLMAHLPLTASKRTMHPPAMH